MPSEPLDEQTPGAELVKRSRRALAYGPVNERLAEATERQAEAAARAPTALETFALSTASSATALVLGGSVLIVVADLMGLVDGVDVWPLVTFAVVLAAAAGLAFVGGSRQRAESLARAAKAVTTPWAVDSRLERVEEKLDELLARGTEPSASQSRGESTE